MQAHCEGTGILSPQHSKPVTSRQQNLTWLLKLLHSPMLFPSNNLPFNLSCRKRENISFIDTAPQWKSNQNSSGHLSTVHTGTRLQLKPQVHDITDKTKVDQSHAAAKHTKKQCQTNKTRCCLTEFACIDSLFLIINSN